ncbi:MAG TPA: ComF family protein [Candidatus Saccharimonadales bacterium]|nr:ComF family protein [Candidatus Saccharimonadales bacterium]
MSFFDALISKLAPHECLGCGYEGQLVCAACSAALATVPPRCYRCHRLTSEARTCETCRSASSLKRVHVAAPYDSFAKDLIWQLKFHGAQAAAVVMAEHLAPLLSDLYDSPTGKAAVLVPVPTATGRARSRGYDQAKLLARELSRRTALPYADCLRRSGQTHQVGASRTQRLAQLQGAFRLKNSSVRPGRSIILVDDVLTTGATLEAAAAILHQAGFPDVQAAVFAQA